MAAYDEAVVFRIEEDRVSESACPAFDELRPAVIAVLADSRVWAFQELCRAVESRLELDETVRDELIPSGQSRLINRLTWVCSGLVHAGLATRTGRGRYQVTADGLTVASRNLSSYSERDMFEWPSWRGYQDEVKRRKRKETEPRPNRFRLTPGPDDDPNASLEDIEEAHADFNAQVETDLRRRLQEASPEFFERAVVELLWAMGYGGAHGAKQTVGRSGDGGVDGVIRQDALGLDNVYIQAKRYADGNSVQRPAIQQFYGALASKRATNGVFITTSTFTSGARAEAESYRDRSIVLVDGVELTSLMLSYGVAVQKKREFTLYEIDEDFFDDETE